MLDEPQTVEEGLRFQPGIPKISDTDSAPASRWAGGAGGGGGGGVGKGGRFWSAWRDDATSPLLSCRSPPFFRRALLPSLTCDPFVRLAVTVVRVAGKVQRVQRADAARAICTEEEGHRRQDQLAR